MKNLLAGATACSLKALNIVFDLQVPSFIRRISRRSRLQVSSDKASKNKRPPYRMVFVFGAADGT